MSRRPNANRTWATPTHRAWLLRRFGRALIALQVLALGLALQMSGALHRVADVFFHDDCEAECGHEGSSDDDDSECPPGCPTCHSCAHAQAVYVPRATFVFDAPIVTRSAFDVPSTLVPPERDLPSIFRPPRI